MQAFWNGLLSLFSNTLKTVCSGWDVVRRGRRTACYKILKAGRLCSLKAVNDACRSPRNQWTAASRFLTPKHVCVCVCLSWTPVVFSESSRPLGDEDEQQEVKPCVEQKWQQCRSLAHFLKERNLTAAGSLFRHQFNAGWMFLIGCCVRIPMQPWPVPHSGDNGFCAFTSVGNVS